jgi:hypothetical protein
MKSIKSFTLNEFLASFIGPKATSPKVALPILLFLSGGSLAIEDFGDQRSTADVFVFLLIAVFISFGFFMAFGSLINALTKNDSFIRIVSLLVLFFTTEVIRTIFIALQISQNESAEEILWGYRIVAGGLTGVLFFGVLSIVINDSTRYKLNLNQLQLAQETLLKTASVTQEDLEKNKAQVIESIQFAINQALKSVLTSSDSNKENTKLIVDEIVRVSDHVVRPLSKEFFDEKFNLENLSSVSKRKTFSSFRIFKLATFVQPFHPFALAIFVFIQLIGVALFLTDNPLIATTTLFFYASWIFIVLLFAKKFLQPKLLQINIFIRVVLVTSLYWLVTASFVFFDSRIAGNLELTYSINLFIYFLIIATLIAWTFATYSAIKFARFEILESVAKINEELNWSKAKLSAKLWVQQKKLGTIIHRDIQGALISSALKFQKDVESGQDPNLAIKQVKDLVEGTSNIISAKTDIPDPKVYLANLNELWDGIISLSLEVNEETFEKILHDPTCWETVNDFIGEFATNSVKHGKASVGEVKIELAEDNILRITMVNNGLPLAADLKHGLGSRMILDQSLSVEHKNLPNGGVFFSVTIPID